MTENGEPYKQILRVVADTRRSKGVETAERVVPYISLGMPLRILLAADETLEFRVVFCPADGAKKFKTFGNLYAVSRKAICERNSSL